MKLSYDKYPLLRNKGNFRYDMRLFFSQLSYDFVRTLSRFGRIDFTCHKYHMFTSIARVLEDVVHRDFLFSFHVISISNWGIFVKKWVGLRLGKYRRIEVARKEAVVTCLRSLTASISFDFAQDKESVIPT